MKKALGLTVALATAIGMWAVRGGPDAAFTLQAGLAILVGGNLLLGLWLWYRARSGSGDAMAAPGVVLLSAAMLIGTLPRVLWPAAKGIQIAGSIASIALTTWGFVETLRRLRRYRRGART